jgi:phosphoribosylaminoimidazole-succinocarboxamide synthase
VFTPAFKAPSGQHDENISFADTEALVGRERAARVRDASLALYAYGAARCERAGILLADTKFEFGVLPDGEVILIDEVMTPDSSRFWEAAAWEPGRAQASYDKQFVRDWLEQQPWGKTAPGPELPDDVVAGTRSRYVEAYERITGASFARYLSEDVIAR